MGTPKMPRCSDVMMTGEEEEEEEEASVLLQAARWTEQS